MKSVGREKQDAGAWLLAAICLVATLGFPGLAGATTEPSGSDLLVVVDRCFSSAKHLDESIETLRSGLKGLKPSDRLAVLSFDCATLQGEAAWSLDRREALSQLDASRSPVSRPTPVQQAPPSAVFRWTGGGEIPLAVVGRREAGLPLLRLAFGLEQAIRSLADGTRSQAILVIGGEWPVDSTLYPADFEVAQGLDSNALRSTRFDLWDSVIGTASAARMPLFSVVPPQKEVRLRKRKRTKRKRGKVDGEVGSKSGGSARVPIYRHDRPPAVSGQARHRTMQSADGTSENQEEAPLNQGKSGPTASSRREAIEMMGGGYQALSLNSGAISWVRRPPRGEEGLWLRQELLGRFASRTGAVEESGKPARRPVTAALQALRETRVGDDAGDGPKPWGFLMGGLLGLETLPNNLVIQREEQPGGDTRFELTLTPRKLGFPADGSPYSAFLAVYVAVLAEETAMVLPGVEFRLVAAGEDPESEVKIPLVVDLPDSPHKVAIGVRTGLGQWHSVMLEGGP